MNLLSKIILVSAIASLVVTSCKKDDDNTNTEPTAKGTVQMNITDSRVPQSQSRNILDDSGQIINPELLTQFKVTFSNILLRNSSNTLVSILASPTTIDLRDFRGNISELLPVQIPLGSYSAVVIRVSGVDIIYDGNTYRASTSTSPLVHVGSVNQDVTQGIPNAFTTEQSFEFAMPFTLTEAANLQDIRLFFDVDASCQEIIVNAPIIGNIRFASVRESFHISAILEQNIQQIMHSPPTGINVQSANQINYYGIHSFVDFAAHGGVINSHTSQHVFRGEDGNLSIDVESMYTNSTALSPNQISASGQTEVRADEVFKYQDYKTFLQTQGYTLEAGKTYYFSLRKTWNITSNGQTYNLTRICEPIPVNIPF